MRRESSREETSRADLVSFLLPSFSSRSHPSGRGRQGSHRPSQLWSRLPRYDSTSFNFFSFFPARFESTESRRTSSSSPPFSLSSLEGILSCLDGYMNIALEHTEEYVNGVKKNDYGDAFIRGNNGELNSLLNLTSALDLELIPFLLLFLAQCFTSLLPTRYDDKGAASLSSVSAAVGREREQVEARQGEGRRRELESRFS